MPSRYTLSVGRVLSAPVNVASLDGVVDCIIEKAKKSLNEYVCVANVHMIVTAEQDESFREIMEKASIVSSDGMPLVWVLKSQGYSQAQRVTGPDLMLKICERAENEGIPIFFYGGDEKVATALEHKLLMQYPSLKVAGVIAPPQLPENPEVDMNLIAEMNKTGAKIIFVGLGCPKQEHWMHAYSPELKGMLIGVGAAFDFMVGVRSRAPNWMQLIGMEWFYRLCSEPKRLWKRYLVTNSKFVFLLVRDLFTSALSRISHRIQ